MRPSVDDDRPHIETYKRAQIAITTEHRGHVLVQRVSVIRADWSRRWEFTHMGTQAEAVARAHEGIDQRVIGAEA